MNRQVGPSILLSVCIVCFFAVVLFQHDPKRLPAGAAGKQGARDRTAARRSVNPPPSSAAARTTAAANGIAIGAERGNGLELNPPGAPSPPSHGNPLQGMVRAASVRSTRGSEVAGSPIIDSVRRPPPVKQPHQPRSAFTLVEPNENIENVAVRIYGSTDAVESLWRANRDLLPTKNSALSPGMILRTPAVKRDFTTGRNASADRPGPGRIEPAASLAVVGSE
jgi:hypothetical protein